MNCKQGDLAVIVCSRAGNEGALVEVLEFLGVEPHYDGKTWNHGLGPCWLVRSLGSPLRRWSVLDSDELNRLRPCPDAWLRPLRGEPVAEQTDTPEVLTA